MRVRYATIPHVVNRPMCRCYCYLKMSWGNCAVKMSSAYGDFHDEPQGVARAGLVTAAVAGRISNRDGAAALHLTTRQFQRLKQRFRRAGAERQRHQGRGRSSHRRLATTVCARVQGRRAEGRSARRLVRSLLLAWLSHYGGWQLRGPPAKTALHRERLMEHFLGGQASGDHRVSRMSCTTRDNRIPILPLRIAS